MDFVVPLLIVVLVVVIGLVIVRLVSRNKTSGAGRLGQASGKPSTAMTKEAAAAASVRLNQQQHTAIYAMIAQGQALAAIREYRNATGAGLREAASAVAQMSAHPQPYTAPQQGAPATQQDKAAEQQEAEPAQRSEPAGYRYRAIVSKGDTIREIASTRLNDDVFARIRSSALGGDRDGAVRLLLEHSEATETEAREFVDLIEPEQEP